MTPGLTGTITLLPGEDPIEFEQLVSSLRSRFASSDKMEEMLIMRAANLMWRLRRAGYFESGLIAWAERSDLQRDQIAPRMGLMKGPTSRLPVRDAAKPAHSTDLDDFHRVGRTVTKLFEQGDILNRLVRYESALMRQLEQTVTRLSMLKARR